MEVNGQPHTPAALTPGKQHRYPLERESRVGPRAGLDAVAKRKIPD